MLKRFLRLAGVSLALATGLAATPSGLLLGPSTSAAAVGDCVPGTNWGTLRQDLATQVVTLVNQHRTVMGLQPLITSPTLSNSAIWKSRHMAYYQYMQHDDPAPPVTRTVADRLGACGYSTTGVGWGENIAYGYQTAAEVMNAWLNSPGHRANIETASFRAIGVGAAAASNGQIYWTQDFGTVADSTSGKGTVTPPPPPPPSPPPATVTTAPGSVTIFSGALQAGDATSLAVADGRNYQVNSAGGRISWYGRFYGLPNAMRSLALKFVGSASQPCTQTVSLWNWTYGYWVVYDSRSVGATPTTVMAAAGGSLADYVSGASGNGDVAVRVSCSRSDYTLFSTSGDLLNVTYGTP